MQKYRKKTKIAKFFNKILSILYNNEKCITYMPR
jgi:hypothetical protein